MTEAITIIETIEAEKYNTSSKNGIVVDKKINNEASIELVQHTIILTSDIEKMEHPVIFTNVAAYKMSRDGEWITPEGNAIMVDDRDEVYVKILVREEGENKVYKIIHKLDFGYLTPTVIKEIIE